MAYEYEEWISITIDEKLAWRGFDPDEETRARDELKEVYAKAKAFNEIVEVFKDYPLKTDSDVMDFIQAKLDDMEDK
ncbi:hypothetical protein [Mammaliicoccus sp. A-M4]|uniref:hypothetical protein n=1 Tax=Mammaliicoccus sp. A-M4 TaxID=2898664 RepID=UPI001EFBCFDB|nr:hypothetical protein [Mammaliicoccus sp. A-M4]